MAFSTDTFINNALVQHLGIYFRNVSPVQQTSVEYRGNNGESEISGKVRERGKGLTTFNYG